MFKGIGQVISISYMGPRKIPSPLRKNLKLFSLRPLLEVYKCYFKSYLYCFSLKNQIVSCLHSNINLLINQPLRISVKNKHKKTDQIVDCWTNMTLLLEESTSTLPREIVKRNPLPIIGAQPQVQIKSNKTKV